MNLRSTKTIPIAATAAAVAAGAYALASSPSSGEEKAPEQGAAIRPAVAQLAAGALDDAPPGARLLVRAVDAGAPRADGRLYELSADGGARRAGRLACKRVHASADGTGLCLTLASNGIDYDGVVFDADYRPKERFPIEGVPDRARVSPDGRYGAFTSFDSDSSQGYFASSNTFTTYTRIHDMRTGEELLALEDLVVTGDGEELDLWAPQFWGVTFIGGDRFYATLATGEEHHLIEGRAGTGRARIVRSRMECPAISPDGTRIAYKRRIGTTNRWRLHVLDLASGEETPLAETRSIDDQPEWLGDDLVAYSDDEAVFATPADGSGEPWRVADDATSQTYLPASQ